MHTILTPNAPVDTTQPADDVANISRAQTFEDGVRCYAGRSKVATLPYPDGANVETVAGILAALTYPLSQAAIRCAVEDALDEVEERKTGSVIPDSYRYSYGVDQNNGDDVAAVLKDHCGGGLKDPLDLAKLEEVAGANGIGDRFDTWMAKGLNPGMVRMNTGNVLRGMVRRGEPVQIGSRKWEAQPEA